MSKVKGGLQSWRQMIAAYCLGAVQGGLCERLDACPKKNHAGREGDSSPCIAQHPPEVGKTHPVAEYVRRHRCRKVASTKVEVHRVPPKYRRVAHLDQGLPQDRSRLKLPTLDGAGKQHGANTTST